jgi:hypothetical protein
MTATHQAQRVVRRRAVGHARQHAQHEPLQLGQALQQVCRGAVLQTDRADLLLRAAAAAAVGVAAGLAAVGGAGLAAVRARGAAIGVAGLTAVRAGLTTVRIAGLTAIGASAGLPAVAAILPLLLLARRVRAALGVKPHRPGKVINRTI